MKNYLEIFVCLFSNTLLCYINHTQTYKAMRNYIATFQAKGRAFNANDIESIWLSAKTRKDAEVHARRIARMQGDKFVSIRWVR